MCAGLATQSVPLYLSEIAPVKVRGSLNIMFQLSITIGILIAELINLGEGLIPPSLFLIPEHNIWPFLALSFTCNQIGRQNIWAFVCGIKQCGCSFHGT